MPGCGWSLLGDNEVMRVVVLVDVVVIVLCTLAHLLSTLPSSVTVLFCIV